MQLNPYLNFNGECEQAFKFYERVLGGKISFMMTWGEMPDASQFPMEAHKLIMHATLKVGDRAIMGADSPPGSYQAPKGMNVSLHNEDTAECERIFNALAEGGDVQMPFQKTFWSAGFGMCVDQFGIPWMINSEREPTN
jgi:PhnB protein